MDTKPQFETYYQLVQDLADESTHLKHLETELARSREHVALAEMLLADKRKQIDVMNGYEEHLEDQIQTLVQDVAGMHALSKVTKAQRLAFALVGVLMEEKPKDAEPELVVPKDGGDN